MLLMTFWVKEIIVRVIRIKRWRRCSIHFQEPSKWPVSATVVSRMYPCHGICNALEFGLKCFSLAVVYKFLKYKFLIDKYKVGAQWIFVKRMKSCDSQMGVYIRVSCRAFLKNWIFSCCHLSDLQEWTLDMNVYVYF